MKKAVVGSFAATMKLLACLALIATTTTTALGLNAQAGSFRTKKMRTDQEQVLHAHGDWLEGPQVKKCRSGLVYGGVNKDDAGAYTKGELHIEQKTGDAKVTGQDIVKAFKCIAKNLEGGSFNMKPTGGAAINIAIRFLAGAVDAIKDHGAAPAPAADHASFEEGAQARATRKAAGGSVVSSAASYQQVSDEFLPEILAFIKSMDGVDGITIRSGGGRAFATEDDLKKAIGTKAKIPNIEITVPQAKVAAIGEFVTPAVARLLLSG
jgi:hypothetical protein